MPSAWMRSGTRPSRSFWPREHGAYVQLLAPLLSALAFARTTGAALGCAMLACALFLAHEPLLVLLGRRGSSCRAVHARAAWTHLVLRLAAALFITLALVLLAPSGVVLSLLVPAGLSLGTLVAVVRGQEKALGAELLVAATLTSFSVPVLVAGGVAPEALLIFVGGFVTVQALATLIVRAYLQRRRDGERSLAAVAAGALLVLGLGAALTGLGRLPLAACLALAPFVAVAVALRRGALRPRTPKGVGWALALANLAAVVLLGMTLPQST